MLDSYFKYIILSSMWPQHLKNQILSKGILGVFKRSTIRSLGKVTHEPRHSTKLENREVKLSRAA